MMFGVECFLSNHKGFLGQVKTFPEDFVVTEISPEGTHASISGSSHVDQCIGPSIHTEIETRTEEVAVDHNDSQVTAADGMMNNREDSDPSALLVTCQKSETNCRTDSSDDHGVLLSSVLDNRTMNELGAFAKQELGSLQGDGSKSPITHEAESNRDSCQTVLNLGFISSKESRTVIHKSLRYLYPHLRTLNRKLPDRDGLEIHVSREPVVSQFQALGAELKRVLEFIRFVESRASEQTFSFPDADSRDRRTKLHRLISKHYGAFLETKTFGDRASKEGQSVVVRFRQKFKDHRKRGRGEKGGTEHKQTFTGFTLQKTNIETLDALQQLARVVDVHASDFSYAGIKDKKAVTTQHMAVKGVTTNRVQAAIAKALPPGLKLGSVYPRDGPIHVGQLWGNHFDIALRGVGLKKAGVAGQPENGDPLKEREMLKDSIKDSISCVEEKGFINYFGEQRFGAASLDPSRAMTTITAADVGHAMLQRKYADAVKLILSPDDGPRADPSESTNLAKHCYLATASPKDALKQMPGHRTRECLLLKALNRHGTEDEGCIKALMNIPHSMRQMYIHAYCSLVWNQMASFRMGCYGYKVVEGDLVLEDESKTKVHTVTKDDITEDSYSINDIVLPLPGNNIQYPPHAAGAEYRRKLAEGGLGDCNFRLPALKLNIPGGYRKLVIHPRNLAWGWGTHVTNDEHTCGDGACSEDAAQEQLPSDPALSIHDGTQRSSTLTIPASSASENHTGWSRDGNESCHRCTTDIRERTPCPNERQSTCRDETLEFSFDLPASCYATIFLRELMKT